MTNEGVFSSEEVLNTFPELMEIKLKMNRISSLQKRIHSITAGPAPNVTIEEEFLLNECNSEISRLKRSVKEQLVQLIASPAIVKSH